MLARLRQDDLARDILNRVDAGPFVNQLYIALLSHQNLKYLDRVLLGGSISQMVPRKKICLPRSSRATNLYLLVMLQD